MLAHTHPRQDADAAIRIVFTDIPKRDLAVITHHVVGIAEDARDQAAAPERRVHAIRDVHVDLDPVVEPRVAVFSCLCLQHPRVVHRVPEPVQRVTEPGGVAGGPQVAVGVQRVLQNRHEQA